MAAMVAWVAAPVPQTLWHSWQLHRPGVRRLFAVSGGNCRGDPAHTARAHCRMLVFSVPQTQEQILEVVEIITQEWVQLHRDHGIRGGESAWVNSFMMRIVAWCHRL